MALDSRHPRRSRSRKTWISARVPVSVVCLLAAAAVLAHSAVNGRDVLLVEHPGKLTVLDEFERTASQQEMKDLQAFSPLLILNDNARLSDGYTKCVKVLRGGRLFYLLTDEHGGLPSAAGIRFIRGATWLGDTVRVKSSLAVEQPLGTRVAVAKGALVERFFELRGRAYVRPLADLALFGWVPWGSIESYLPVKTEEILPRASDSTIAAIVRTKIDESNTVLERLYRMFDKQTRRSLAAPRWHISSQRGVLVCDLENSRVSYEQSTRYLAKDIENALLGTGARVDLSAQRITVYLP